MGKGNTSNVKEMLERHVEILKLSLEGLQMFSDKSGKTVKVYHILTLDRDFLLILV